MLSRVFAQLRKEEASGWKELKWMPLMCLSLYIAESTLGPPFLMERFILEAFQRPSPLSGIRLPGYSNEKYALGE